MERLTCPHCRSGRLAGAPVPKDVVVVMPCPACSGLVVMFRKKALALDRKILAELAVSDPTAFAKLAETARAQRA